MRRVLLAVGILYASLFTSACSTNDTPPAPKTIEQIDRAHDVAVQARLKGDGELAGEQIKVTAKGDTIVLEGSVQTAEEKERAEKLAREVNGVKSVENKLEIRPNTP